MLCAYFKYPEELLSDVLYVSSKFPGPTPNMMLSDEIYNILIMEEYLLDKFEIKSFNPLYLIITIKIKVIIRKKYNKKILKFLIDLSEKRKKIIMIDNSKEIKAPIDFVNDKVIIYNIKRGVKIMRYFFSFFKKPIVIGIIIIKKPANVLG
ncbi:MAG: hypothetical protein N3E50_03135 [Candidatus Goldbacteria bacterium]|nr:hypothetical protein [Candidatus Goldiibacteriota bacterium]